MNKLKDEIDRMSKKLEETSEGLANLQASIQSYAKRIDNYKKELKRIGTDLDKLKKHVG